MINNDDFAKRLKIVLDFYQLSAANFAEKINVQRSSISHLLSGRNKPSLDFVLKVLKEFKEVELYWLLNGKGNFPKTDMTSVKEESITSTLFPKNHDQNKIATKQKVLDQSQNNNNKNNIDRIVIFYKDGTYKEYKN